MVRAGNGAGAFVLQGLRLGWEHPAAARLRGGVVAAFGLCLILAFASYRAADPSWNTSAAGPAHNLLGATGARLADVGLQSLGLAAWVAAALMVVSGLGRVSQRDPAAARARLRLRAGLGALGVLALAGLMAAPPAPAIWPLAQGLGGVWGDGILHGLAHLFAFARIPYGLGVSAALLALAALAALATAVGLRGQDFGAMAASARDSAAGAARDAVMSLRRPEADLDLQSVATPVAARRAERAQRAAKPAPLIEPPESDIGPPIEVAAPLVFNTKSPKPSKREEREQQAELPFATPKEGEFTLPELSMLAKPKPRQSSIDEGGLRQNARLLESVLAEFGVRASIRFGLAQWSPSMSWSPPPGSSTAGWWPCRTTSPAR